MFYFEFFLLTQCILLYEYSDVVYVSSDGVDSSMCGSSDGIDACKTLAYGFKQRQSNLSELVVERGVYTETIKIVVDGTLMVTGQSQGNTFISTKNNADFILFTFSKTATTLVVSSFTIVLSNHTKNGGFISLTGVNVNVSATLRACRITMVKVISINGQSMFIDNSMACLIFDSCTVYNISTDPTPFIYSPGKVQALCISNSSFVNINSQKKSSCFFAQNGSNLTLIYSLFILCSSSAGGGVGQVYCLLVAGRVEGCVFWNNTLMVDVGGDDTTGRGSSALDMQADVSAGSKEPLPLAVTNTSFVYCVCMAEAKRAHEALGLSWDVGVVLANCSFTWCTAPTLDFDEVMVVSCMRSTIARRL